MTQYEPNFIEIGLPKIDISAGFAIDASPEPNSSATSPPSSNIVPAPSGTVMKGGAFQSSNFIKGVAGWQLDANGNIKANDGDFRGTITATTGAIGGFNIGSDYIRDVANSFGLASTVTGGDDVRFWAGATFANRATAPARITEAGSAVFTSVQVGGTNIQYTLNDNGYFSFGDGSDGAATFNGTDAVTGATRSGTTYTLDRDVYYTSATVSTGVTIKTNGYRIFGTGTLTLNGTATIHRNGESGANGSNGNGANGCGGAGGAALTDGYLKGSVAGGAGGHGGLGACNAGDNGTAGSAASNTTNSIGSNGVAGGAGGAGTGGTGGAAGGAGTATAANVKLIANWHLATLLDIGTSGATVKFDNSSCGGGGGGGGKGGGGTTAGGGGGGGSSGGIMAIYFRVITIGASASVTANGGNGGSGGNGENAAAGRGGGGGGGNGGQVILVYNSLTNNGTISANGGSAGSAGTGTGTGGVNGTAGSAGNVRQFNLSL